MGATASTDIATHFFEETRSVPCHLDLNHKPSIRVSDEGVKLMPGGALVVETIECPLHQVGDGKGVSGHLRTVDSPIPESAESKLKANNKLVSDRIKLLKEKSLAMATETTPSEFPGKMSTIAEPKNNEIEPLIVIEGDRKSQDLFQVEATFSPKSLPTEGAKLLSSECPMQHKNLSPGTEPKPLSQIQGIPENMTQPNVPVVDHTSFTHQYSLREGTMKQEKVKPFNPKSSGDNKMMSPKRFSADQTFPLATDTVLSNIPKTDADETWANSARQMFWNAMLRKGWKWDNADMSTQEMENIISVYSANNQLAWREVLKWEALHADECKEPKLKKFSIFATKYSPRARLRSWIGYELPFDRHDWIVDRNGKEVRYIIDYYDGGKMNTNFEFALLDVRPALDSFEALRDRVKVFWDRWTSKPQDTIPPAANPVPDLSRISEPLNFSRRPATINDGPEKFQETKPSQFMPYSLSDIEKERERKNSVS